MDVLLAQPRGFCAGVVRAVDVVQRALQLHGAPVYVFHEIVHNGHVVADLRDKGAIARICSNSWQKASAPAALPAANTRTS